MDLDFYFWAFLNFFEFGFLFFGSYVFV